MNRSSAAAPLRRLSVALSVALLLGACGPGTIASAPDARPESAPVAASTASLYPGAAVLTGAPAPAGVAPLPSFTDAVLDSTANDGCVMGSTAPVTGAVLRCTFGPRTATLRLAAVGDSHMGHLAAALRSVARRLDVRITLYQRNACPFANPSPRPKVLPGCLDWVDAVATELAARPPDAVIVTDTYTWLGRPEQTSRGMIAVWRRLARAGIPLIGIRDTARFATSLPECAMEHGAGSSLCRFSTEGSLAPIAPVLRADLTGISLRHIDMGRWICPRTTCRPVIGNVTVFRDQHHLTDTYARTLAPMLADALRPIVTSLRADQALDSMAGRFPLRR